MPKLKDLKAVDEHYARTGSHQTTLQQSLPCAAPVAFDAFKDPATWKAFLGLAVEWTSPEPFGVGTTRTVKLNGQTIEELFLVWEQDHRMGFRFTRSTLPVAAFAEEYELVPSGANSCELHWHYAWEWGGPLEPLLSPIFGTLFTANAKRSLPKLAKHLAGRTA